MVGSYMYAQNKLEDLTRQVAYSNKNVDKLIAERRSGSQLTASLSDLDSRTIDEDKSTRLDLLRYLGLEELRDLKVTFNLPSNRRIGKNSMTVRSIIVNGSLPYEEALNQLDYFYNTKKVSIKSVSMFAPKKGVYGDVVNFTLEGEIYAIRK